MSSDQADGVKGKFTVVGGPREKSRTRFTVRVDLRARDADVDAGLDPDDAWLAQAARRRRLVLGLVAVSLMIALLFMWVL